jgi:hypothetical protein
MSRLDKFRFQQVPDIESNDDSEEFDSEAKQVKAETVASPGQRAKEYLLNHHQSDFFSAIIDQENARFKHFLLELDIDWKFLQGLHPSTDIQGICVDILQELTKSKLQPETVHVAITPIGIDLETITTMNKLFPIPKPVPVFSKIQCTVVEQLQKSFHILAKVYQCNSEQCREKSVIYKIQNSVHDILNKSSGPMSSDWHEISLFKRSSNTGTSLS